MFCVIQWVVNQQPTYLRESDGKVQTLRLQPDDVDIHVLDSTLLHAVAALNYAIE